RSAKNAKGIFLRSSRSFALFARNLWRPSFQFCVSKRCRLGGSCAGGFGWPFGGAVGAVFGSFGSSGGLTVPCRGRMPLSGSARFCCGRPALLPAEGSTLVGSTLLVGRTLVCVGRTVVELGSTVSFVGSTDESGAPVMAVGGGAPRRTMRKTTRRFFDVISRQVGVSCSSGAVQPVSSYTGAVCP